MGRGKSADASEFWKRFDAIYHEKDLVIESSTSIPSSTISSYRSGKRFPRANEAIAESGIIPAIRAHEAEIIRAAAERAGRAVLDAGYGQQLAEMVTNAVLATPRGMAGNADSRPLAAFAYSGEQSMPDAEKAGLL